jgi:streptomycin 3"-adenylyltransferase
MGGMTGLMNIPTEVVKIQNIVTSLLGNAVESVYLYGSATLGGLRKDSDVDVLVVIYCDISYDIRKVLTDELMKISGKIGNTDGMRYLELTIVKHNDIVPWKYPPMSQYQYGEWLRDDFDRGWIPQSQPAPDLAIALSLARQHSVALVGKDAAHLLKPIPAADLRRALKDCLPGLLNNLKGDERNVLLTLARMWATAVTGDFLSKDKAAEWATGRIPTEWRGLLDLAARAYCGECIDDWETRGSELVEFAELLRQNIEEAL